MEAVGAGALLSFAPAVADGGPRDAQRRVHHGRDGLEHLRRRGIARKRLAADHAAVLDQCREGAPMGKLREACDGHGDPSCLEGSKMTLLRGETQPRRDPISHSAVFVGWREQFSSRRTSVDERITLATVSCGRADCRCGALMRNP